jgi:hypothetical protein
MAFRPLSSILPSRPTHHLTYHLFPRPRLLSPLHAQVAVEAPAPAPAPAKTPKPIIDRLHKEIVKALNEPDLQGRLLSEGSEIGGIPPEEFKKYIINEIAKWTKVVKDAKIQVD